MPVYRGENSQFLLQMEPSLRGNIAVPDAYKMQFDTVSTKDNEVYSTDDTIDNDSILAKKRYASDQSRASQIKALFCLNNVGLWLRLMCGAPVTTGLGPYVHTFTLNNSVLTALTELGYIDAGEFVREIGVAVNTFGYSATDKAQKIDVGMIAAAEVLPAPTVVFDAAPTVLAPNPACSHGGYAFDVEGASTLGALSEISVNINRNVVGLHLADNQIGYGQYDSGRLEISGTLTALFTDATSLRNYMRNHTSIPLSIISQNNNKSASLRLNLPMVEFDKPTDEVTTRMGVFITANYMAHANAAEVPTFVLTNGIASYA